VYYNRIFTVKIKEENQPVKIKKEEEEVKAEFDHALSHVATELMPVVYLSWVVQANVT